MSETRESNGHKHTISNPASGFTDPHIDGHRHKLHIPGCQACRKARKLASTLTEKVGVSLFSTTWVQGHLHYFDSDIV